MNATANYFHSAAVTPVAVLPCAAEFFSLADLNTVLKATARAVEGLTEATVSETEGEEIVVPETVESVDRIVGAILDNFDVAFAIATNTRPTV